MPSGGHCRYPSIWSKRHGAARRYCAAEKRLSNEFAGTIGWAPPTRADLAAGAGGVSETDGFSGGLAAACLVSGLRAGSGCGSVRLATIDFGFAAGGVGALAVVSAVAPPNPTLRARLLKNPSDGALGAAAAIRVDGSGVAATAAGSSRLGGCGGLTWEGMVPGARAKASSDRLWPSPPSDRPVLPLGSLAANTLFMPPSMPVFIRATGVPFATSL